MHANSPLDSASDPIHVLVKAQLLGYTEFLQYIYIYKLYIAPFFCKDSKNSISAFYLMLGLR